MQKGGQLKPGFLAKASDAAMVFSKILKKKLYIWSCKRVAAIFTWGISLHLSWDMVSSKTSSAVNEQMSLRLHPVSGNLCFVL